MSKKEKQPQLARRFFENIFVRRQYHESLNLISEGLIACTHNAKRLFDDVQLLMQEQRWTSASFLLATTNEEMAKCFILLDSCKLDFSRHQAELLRLCYAFYDHTKKYAYIQIVQTSDLSDMSSIKREWLGHAFKWVPASVEEQEDPVWIHDTHFVREMPIYIDFLDYEQRWSNPRNDVAENAYNGFFRPADAQTTLKRLLRSLDSGLYTPEILEIVNDNFKKYYFSDKSSSSQIQNLHRLTAQRIETEYQISEEDYFSSALYEWPMYHFTTISY